MPLSLKTKLADYTDMLVYIQQMPGLEAAIKIGSKAVVRQHLTTVEMCEAVRLYPPGCQMLEIDNDLSKLAEVLMGAEQSCRVSRIGDCCYTVREYPGCMFPFFLNILDTYGLQPNA